MDEIIDAKVDSKNSGISESKSLKQRYFSAALWFAIVGAIPWIISLFDIMSTTPAEAQRDILDIGIILFSLWLLITIPSSIIIGIVAISFSGYALKLSDADQSLKQRAQIARVLGWLDILIPLGILLFFLIPTWVGARGN